MRRFFREHRRWILAPIMLLAVLMLITALLPLLGLDLEPFKYPAN